MLRAIEHAIFLDGPRDVFWSLRMVLAPTPEIMQPAAVMAILPKQFRERKNFGGTDLVLNCPEFNL